DPAESGTPPCRRHSSSCTGRPRDTAYSDPLDDLFAEQPLRPEYEKAKRDHVGEPALDAAAEQRTPVELTELLADANDQPANDSAGYRGEPAEDQHRQRL